jgi:hypothetical protein
MGDHPKIYHASGRQQIDWELPVSAFPNFGQSQQACQAFPRLAHPFTGTVSRHGYWVSLVITSISLGVIVQILALSIGLPLVLRLSYAPKDLLIKRSDR